MERTFGARENGRTRRELAGVEQAYKINPR